MDIYIVQQGDTIDSIAERYGITVEKLILDNGLVYPYNLVLGQAIVIAYPKQTHIVQQGDTLQGIADSYNVSLMQLLRNNPFLFDIKNIYPGETIIVSYNTTGSIAINGYAYPYIKNEILIKTLPNLTYLSVFNYTTTEKGEIITYQDDLELIKMSKDYGVIPLMLLTTLTLQGIPNIEVSNSILQNEEYLQNNINGFTNIMKSKGYQ